jgi:hypothetical protein
MKKELTYIAPLRTGIVLAVLYGILSVIIVPFLLVAAILGSKASTPARAAFGVG